MSWFPVWMNIILCYPKFVSTETLSIIRANFEPSAPLSYRRKVYFKKRVVPGCSGDMTKFIGCRDYTQTYGESTFSFGNTVKIPGENSFPVWLNPQCSSIASNFLCYIFSGGVLSVFVKELVRYTTWRYYVAASEYTRLQSGPLIFLKGLIFPIL